jgi:hypothetical protein
MKLIILFGLLVCSSAFAENSEMVQALFDNNEKITELKSECASGVREVSSKTEKQGVWTHIIKLGRQRRGESKADCEITIVQDYTPTYHDAGIVYKISVKSLK